MKKTFLKIFFLTLFSITINAFSASVGQDSGFTWDVPIIGGGNYNDSELKPGTGTGLVVQCPGLSCPAGEEFGYDCKCKRKRCPDSYSTIINSARQYDLSAFDNTPSLKCYYRTANLCNPGFRLYNENLISATCFELPCGAGSTIVNDGTEFAECKTFTCPANNRIDNDRTSSAKCTPLSCGVGETIDLGGTAKANCKKTNCNPLQKIITNANAYTTTPVLNSTLKCYQNFATACVEGYQITNGGTENASCNQKFCPNENPNPEGSLTVILNKFNTGASSCFKTIPTTCKENYELKNATLQTAYCAKKECTGNLTNSITTAIVETAQCFKKVASSCDVNAGYMLSNEGTENAECIKNTCPLSELNISNASSTKEILANGCFKSIPTSCNEYYELKNTNLPTAYCGEKNCALTQKTITGATEYGIKGRNTEVGQKCYQNFASACLSGYQITGAGTESALCTKMACQETPNLTGALTQTEILNGGCFKTIPASCSSNYKLTDPLSVNARCASNQCEGNLENSLTTKTVETADCFKTVPATCISGYILEGTGANVKCSKSRCPDDALPAFAKITEDYRNGNCFKQIPTLCNDGYSLTGTGASTACTKCSGGSDGKKCYITSCLSNEVLKGTGASAICETKTCGTNQALKNGGTADATCVPTSCLETQILIIDSINTHCEPKICGANTRLDNGGTKDAKCTPLICGFGQIVDKSGTKDAECLTTQCLADEKLLTTGKCEKVGCSAGYKIYDGGKSSAGCEKDLCGSANKVINNASLYLAQGLNTIDNCFQNFATSCMTGYDIKDAGKQTATCEKIRCSGDAKPTNAIETTDYNATSCFKEIPTKCSTGYEISGTGASTACTKCETNETSNGIKCYSSSCQAGYKLNGTGTDATCVKNYCASAKYEIANGANYTEGLNSAQNCYQTFATSCATSYELTGSNTTAKCSPKPCSADALSIPSNTVSYKEYNTGTCFKNAPTKCSSGYELKSSGINATCSKCSGGSDGLTCYTTGCGSNQKLIGSGATAMCSEPIICGAGQTLANGGTANAGCITTSCSANQKLVGSGASATCQNLTCTATQKLNNGGTALASCDTITCGINTRLDNGGTASAVCTPVSCQSGYTLSGGGTKDAKCALSSCSGGTYFENGACKSCATGQTSNDGKSCVKSYCSPKTKTITNGSNYEERLVGNCYQEVPTSCSNGYAISGASCICSGTSKEKNNKCYSRDSSYTTDPDSTSREEIYFDDVLKYTESSKTCRGDYNVQFQTVNGKQIGTCKKLKCGTGETLSNGVCNCSFGYRKVDTKCYRETMPYNASNDIYVSSWDEFVEGNYYYIVPKTCNTNSSRQLCQKRGGVWKLLSNGQYQQNTESKCVMVKDCETSSKKSASISDSDSDSSLTTKTSGVVSKSSVSAKSATTATQSTSALSGRTSASPSARPSTTKTTGTTTKAVGSKVIRR